MRTLSVHCIPNRLIEYMLVENLVVVCADVGSIARKNFGWWASNGQWGKDLSSLSTFVSQSLNAGAKVALGFECPLFVLVAEDEATLMMARPGEGNRPWSAGAGSGAFATGVVQVVWALRSIRSNLAQPQAFLDWGAFERANSGLFVWEAFISGAGKISAAAAGGIDIHVADARAGVGAFLDALPDPIHANSILPGMAEVHSLVGAALIRSGWSTDLALLSQACLVLKV